MNLADFVLAQLPPLPARVLEIGCGAGELATRVAAAGHDVTAIDPEAPEGEIFRRTTLEEFVDPGRFDAVVASRSLHHVGDLAGGLTKIAALLRPGGVLVLDEFAWGRLDEATAQWYYGQLRALAAAGRRAGAPASLEECLDEWREEHGALHGYEEMRRELDARFRERLFSWEPYLYRYLEGATGDALERALIDAAAIQALGFRYVGERS